ncbi:polyprenyl synthetase family protein [Cryptosporangium aurantiacum]|uniref:Geranylgeranyl diphosphate synthase, type I n=1 Tax=Cryptosporangium aurantiacum TaxID=134849 RepID=A0A1M7RHC4_9ACTN|nr:polyprenyl synthetase family protein [Cryptosporangium aurantiacum]SHN45561.1 geranylgeranyl diphosphate synthase, type I [Cryptosporangium aurantiacum]
MSTRTVEAARVSPTNADVRARVGLALEDFLADYVAVLGRVGEELSDLDGPLQAAVLAGGKRLRPLFAYWGARAAGAPDDETLIRAAASLELLHAFALIHDDVMDGSDLRRGRPSAHRALEAAHRAAGLHGDPERFGQAAAILLGDLLLVLSEQMLATAGLPSLAASRARDVFATMRLELMAGQYLDIAAPTRGGVPLERALRIARYKSGKYTVEAPLHLGAAVADAPATVVDAYTAFALPIGEAFQLRDDLLGVFGDSAVTGKPSGEDLREGKQTVLVALARSRASNGGRALLAERLGNPDLDDEGVAALRALIVETGARESVERMITERCDHALAVLASAPFTPEGRAALRDLAVAAVDRSA